MDAVTARATLVSYLGGAAARPALDDPEVDALLARFQVADRYGRRPTDTGWEPTWALNAAAAEGWRLKGSRVAGDFNFSADGASFSKGEVMAHCLEMEQRYAAMDRGTFRTDGVDADYSGERLWL